MIHAYGFIIGVATVIGLQLMEIQLQKQQVNLDDFYSVFWPALVIGFVSARLYHVLTDFYLYRDSWLDIFKVWQGGLSIIGGVMGGVGSAWLMIAWKNRNLANSKKNGVGKLESQKLDFLVILDSVVFGLPVAQAVGRLGNYVNQELYGLPTQLPWKIYIQPLHRLVGFENVAYYHPLFLYEMVLLLGFAGWVWWRSRQQKSIKKDVKKQGVVSGFEVGSGRLFILYVFYYSFIRFWLDFIRLDKMNIFMNMLGFNQILLLGGMLVSGYFLLRNFRQ